MAGVQVELVVDEMRRSLARRAGVDRRLPQFVGLSGFQDFAINIVVLVRLLPVPAMHVLSATSTYDVITCTSCCVSFGPYELWLAGRLAVAQGPAVIMSKTYGAVTQTAAAAMGGVPSPSTGLHQPALAA